jgi:DNA-binding transcriptional LysR family regulator
MEIYQLQSFIAVSETGNLTRAARRMNISQSALSSQIKALEAELGVDLFIRQPKGMQLTRMGMDLLFDAGAVVRASLQMKQKAMDLQTRVAGVLNIGINTDPKFLQVSDISRRMTEKMPVVNLSFLESQTFETVQMLKKEKIDVGYHYGLIQEESIFSLTLSMVDVCVVIPADMAEHRENADIEIIAGLPWVWTRHGCPFHMEFHKRLKGKNIKLNQVTDAVEENIVKELVKSGTGVALMRKDEALDLVREQTAIIWKGFGIQMPLGIACLEKRKAEKIISGFLDVIKEKYQIG